MTLFTNISRLYTFQALQLKEGRQPTAADLQVIDDAVLLISKTGNVEWVGSAKDARAYFATQSKAWRARVQKVSLKGAVVLPSFVECHTHLLYAGSRAAEFERRNRGDSYLEIAASGGGIRSTVLATEKATLAELEATLISRLRELSRQGVTTVEVKTGYAATIKEEKRHLELLFKIQQQSQKKSAKGAKLPRLIVTCLAAHSIPKGETEESWLKQVTGLIPQVKRMGARLDIFIEKGSFSLRGGEALLRAAVSDGVSVTVHADQLSAGGGTSLGVKLRALSVDHVIEAGSKDITSLAKSGTVAVLLPAADLYTRLPYPKARQMIDEGVRVALATDHNPGTSPGLDIALVGVLARTMMQMTLPEVLAAYTVNAAAALGLQEKVGALKRGFAADFICLKPGCDLPDLFYEIGPSRSHAAIASVWRDGHRFHFER